MLSITALLSTPMGLVGEPPGSSAASRVRCEDSLSSARAAWRVSVRARVGLGLLAMTRGKSLVCNARTVAGCVTDVSWAEPEA